MPRPQGVQSEKFVDAFTCALSETTLERSFGLADLPRLQEAGAGEGSTLQVRFRFLKVDARVAVEGILDGVAKLVCQRCMKVADVPLQDRFNLILVQDDAELSQEVAGYEPILADPARLDLHLLAEDQALLALPLVPRHELDCVEDSNAVLAAPVAAAADKGTTQAPFKNLRDMMRGQ
jgi:uncharacterized protein